MNLTVYIEIKCVEWFWTCLYFGVSMFWCTSVM